MTLILQGCVVPGRLVSGTWDLYPVDASSEPPSHVVAINVSRLLPGDIMTPDPCTQNLCLENKELKT